MYSRNRGFMKKLNLNEDQTSFLISSVRRQKLHLQKTLVNIEKAAVKMTSGIKCVRKIS
tara:strand:- start:79 stop:255 length:177 start_codon:yes stop_codon:yes gene_type:complete